MEKQSLFGNIRITFDTHALMASYLTLLLATLGIMIGLFTVTGFINRTGGKLLVLRIFILVIITCKVEIYVNYWIIEGVSKER